ncbi:MAG: penicillin-binding protein 2, partial [Bacteroidetes bacterium]
IFSIRLFYLQVIDDTYKLSAQNQALRKVPLYPTRGLIYDRNKQVLVYNEAAYDLMVIPRKVKNIDTLAFCNLVGITKEKFIEKITKAKKYSRYKPSVFISQITADEYYPIEEQLYKYPGFYGEKRLLRKYSYPIAAHVLGYLAEVDNQTIQNNPYYKKGDYIGKSGLEKQYEEILRGKKGISVQVVDVHNRVKEKFKDGKYDTLPVAGKNITISIDAQLQAYGEKLMQNKKGSIVAIEPETGEILAMVSSPAYDPNLLSGRHRGNNYMMLLRNDSLKPLYNRAILAPYPPGSIFKIIQGLIALDEGVITPNTGFACNKALVGCHNHPAPSNLQKAIQFSCNPYFYRVFERLIQRNPKNSIFEESHKNLDIWRQKVLTFGLGSRLQTDLPVIRSGSVPSSGYYDKIYGEKRWAFKTIYSLSIGQGEVQVIPLQMANLAAIIANRGWYITPHFIKSVENSDSIPEIYRRKNYVEVDSSFFPIVIDAMQQVVEAPHGTARRARIDSITVCGKTGTAQNPHGEDHSVFMAFAPKKNPKIAVAVYVENAGFGGTWAAPIASLMIEKYLRGYITDKEKEKRILEADLLNVIPDEK